MKQTSESLGYGRVIGGMLLIYLLIFLWELVSTPLSRPPSHSQSGVLLSLFALLYGAVRMGRQPGAPSRFFVYGALGSLLFLPRFLDSESFHDWIWYETIRPELIILDWIIIAVLLGTLCRLAATSNEPLSSSDDDQADQLS